MKINTLILLVGTTSLTLHVPITRPIIQDMLKPRVIEVVKHSVVDPTFCLPEQADAIIEEKCYRPHKRFCKPQIQRAKLIKKAPAAWNKMVEGVKRWEGFRAKPYYCSGGKKTIGYGHTGRWVKRGYISEADAEKLLEEQLNEAKQKVLKIVEVPLTEHQLAALTSFTFNCGCGALKKLVDQNGRLNDGNYDSVKKIMPLYRKAGGKINQGLVNRRAWELTLWEA